MAEEDKKKDEEELVIVEEGAENTADTTSEKKSEVEDERLRNDDDDDDDTENKDGETPEQRSARRKEERRKRKERQKRAEQKNRDEVDDLRRQNAELNKRLGSIENHTLGREARDVDQRMSAAQSRYEYAEQAMAEATAKGDGKGLVLATRAKDEAAAAYNTAKQIKERLSSLSEEPRQKQAPTRQGPDPEVAKKAKAFVTRHTWIDPSGRADEDSAIAQTIDKRLQAEGLDPRDDDYWSELETRLKKRLPHRFTEDTRRKEPPLNTGGDRSGSGKKTFVLSKARKDALVESGDWDDPVRRMKMIKNYAAYDAAQKAK